MNHRATSSRCVALDLLVDPVGHEGRGRGVGRLKNSGLHGVIDFRRRHGGDGCPGTGQHLLERLSGRAGLQAFHVVRFGDALVRSGETAGKIAVHQNHHVVVGHFRFKGFHEGRVAQTRRVIVVFHEARHQGEVIGRLLAAGIAERQDCHVELAAAQGLVLLARFEQRLRTVDLDLQIDVCGGDFVGDDLRDLMADVLIRPLVRQAQFRGVGHCGAARNGQGGNGALQNGFHMFLPKSSPQGDLGE